MKSSVYADIFPAKDTETELAYGETKTVYAYAKYDSNKILSHVTTKIKAPPAVSVSSATVKDPS